MFTVAAEIPLRWTTTGLCVHTVHEERAILLLSLYLGSGLDARHVPTRDRKVSQPFRGPVKVGLVFGGIGAARYTSPRGSG